jgi:hypothetical protein
MQLRGRDLFFAAQVRSSVFRFLLDFSQQRSNLDRDHVVVRAGPSG